MPSMDRQNKFQNSDICQQMCGECGKKYTGQTGRIWKHAIRNIYIILEVIIPILNVPNTF